MFFIVALSILTLMYSYVGWRLILPSALSPLLGGALWILIAVSFVLLPLPIFLRMRGREESWVDSLAWAGYLSLGVFSLLFPVLMLRDVLWFILLSVGAVMPSLTAVIDAGIFGSGSVNPGHGLFIIRSVNAAIVGFTAVVAGWGLYRARSAPRVNKVDIRLENLPDDLVGLTILQLTDLHVGPTIKRAFVQRVVDVAATLNPDVIALTGDIADGSVSRLRNEAAPLKQLHAPLGKFFVTGNHEYYSGVFKWLAELKSLGFKTLINEHAVLRKGSADFVLAGVTDRSAGIILPEHASNPHATLEGAPEVALKILLAHQPRTVFKASYAGFDLQLSGHTHGGQYLPYNFLVALDQPFIAGLHKYGDTQVFVNRGCGYWGPPLRLNSPPEIALITITRA